MDLKYAAAILNFRFATLRNWADVRALVSLPAAFADTMGALVPLTQLVIVAAEADSDFITFLLELSFTAEGLVYDIDRNRRVAYRAHHCI